MCQAGRGCAEVLLMRKLTLIVARFLTRLAVTTPLGVPTSSGIWNDNCMFIFSGLITYRLPLNGLENNRGCVLPCRRGQLDRVGCGAHWGTSSDHMVCGL